MSRLLAFVAVLLLAAPAWAADQWQTCTQQHLTGAPLSGNSLIMQSEVRVSSSDIQKELCYDTDGSTTSAVIDVSNCQEIDVEAFNLTDGSLVGHSLEWYSCRDRAGLFCNLVGSALDDTNLTHQGRGTGYGYCDVTNAGSDALTCKVRCNGG